MYIKVEIWDADVVSEPKPVEELMNYQPDFLPESAKGDNAPSEDYWEDPRMIPVKTANIRYVKILSVPPARCLGELGKILDKVL